MTISHQSLIKSVRWIAILPVALIVPIVFAIISVLLMLFGEVMSGDLWLYMEHPEIFAFNHFFASFIIAAIIGYGFVSSGAICAPSHRKGVAFVLFGVLSVVFGFMLITSLIFGRMAETWRFDIGCLISIVSAGAAAFNADKRLQ